MEQPPLTITFTVNADPAGVFDAICNVRGWWSSLLEGNSSGLHDTFIYRYKDLHVSTQTVTELLPGKKIVWLVSDSSLSFIKKKDEWNGTTISFEISGKEDRSTVVFIHHGLVPAVECYEACSGGWNYYLLQSLVPLINTGKGHPD